MSGIWAILIYAVLLVIGFKILRKSAKFLFWVCVIGGGIFVLSVLGVIPSFF